MRKKSDKKYYTLYIVLAVIVLALIVFGIGAVVKNEKTTGLVIIKPSKRECAHPYVDLKCNTYNRKQVMVCNDVYKWEYKETCGYGQICGVIADELGRCVGDPCDVGTAECTKEEEQEIAKNCKAAATIPDYHYWKEEICSIINIQERKKICVIRDGKAVCELEVVCPTIPSCFMGIGGESHTRLISCQVIANMLTNQIWETCADGEICENGLCVNEVSD
jgi:hypothetical protein